MIKNTYFDLIDQTFYFPQEGFDMEDGYLLFHGVPLKHLIEKYGTPLKLTYLPKIGTQVKKARNMFSKARKTLGYKGAYKYCYCTKSSHFSYVLKEVLKYGSQLEISSSFDIDLTRKLYENKWIDKNITIIANGFKTGEYAYKISSLLNEGFKNVVPVLDNKNEIDFYEKYVKEKCKIGIRVATDEEPNFEFYTSRLGMRGPEVIDFYKKRLAKSKKFDVCLLHFFVDTGIRDSIYYWGELKKAVRLYCELKKICPTLTGLNIGGGMPIRNSLGFEFDYIYMVRQILNLILEACREEGMTEPDIYTEFGKYTVGESGAYIFSVLDQKQQNDAELWYMIDNSLITTMPDSWGIAERFILLPVNKWNNEYRRVNIGGLACDNSDYYNAEVHESQGYLPGIGKNEKEPLYLGFFHTGAYQDSLSGYGGLKHCLIPAPRHVLIFKDAKGNIVDKLLREEQKPEDMLKILGYE